VALATIWCPVVARLTANRPRVLILRRNEFWIWHSVRRKLRRVPRADGPRRRSDRAGHPVYLAIAETLPSAKSSPTACAEPRCRPSPRAWAIVTDAQIDVLTRDIRSVWSMQGILDTLLRPLMPPKSEGDIQRGEATYKTYCGILPRSDGGGGPKGSASRRTRFLRSPAIKDCARS